MSSFCLYQVGNARHAAPATHRLFSRRDEPGVWNILAAEPVSPLSPYAREQPEFCLACAMTVAERRMETWRTRTVTPGPEARVWPLHEIITVQRMPRDRREEG